MFVSIDKCTTSDIRNHLKEMGLSYSKTRSESIAILKEHHVYVLDVHVTPSAGKKKPSKTKTPVVIANELDNNNITTFSIDNDTSRNLFSTVNVFDVTPTDPTTDPTYALDDRSLTTTDAVFSHAAIRNLVVNSSLNVGGYNIVQEIDRIKHLRFLLLQDFESIRIAFDNMRVAFQSIVNQDMPMYNIAHDIAHEYFQNTIEFENGITPTISSPSFYGKIEDTTVNLDMNFVVEFHDQSRVSRFTIQLPHAMDTQVLTMVPVMVTVYFDYNDQTGDYGKVSSISHGYIDQDRIHVYANVLKDVRFTRFQFDIAARYLCIIDEETITPMRFGSLHKQTSAITYGNVSHQWSDVDRRVDLFTNLNVTQIDINTDTIYIPLPVPMMNSTVHQVVGFGSLHYTTNLNALSQTVYTTNTPLVYISNSNLSLLVVKSNLFKGFMSIGNNMQTMKLAIHISYQRAIPDDYVYNVYKDSTRVYWNTRTPINPYYFNIIKVNSINVLDTLTGSQNTWSVVYTSAVIEVTTFNIKLNDDYEYNKSFS